MMGVEGGEEGAGGREAGTQGRRSQKQRGG